MSNKKAFTLIELIIVIVILGVLASLITGNFITSLKKGRDAKRKADLEQIQRALEMYYEDKRVYPATEDFVFGVSLCETKDCNPNEKVYMQKIPNDPITVKTYQYLSSIDNSGYKLFACLENNLQKLPYISVGGSTLSCGQCRNPDDTADVDCIWAISSTNLSP